MNIESFKNVFISLTGRKGFQWSEIETQQKNMCVLKTIAEIPNYVTQIYVSLFDNSILIEINLNKAVYSTDTLKLINDFNDNVRFLKAYISEYEGETYLTVSASDYFVSSAEDGANAFLRLFNYIQSQEVAVFLRPLTIISRR